MRLNTRKKYRTGKRVAIEGRIFLLRDSILREVERAEKVVKEKKVKKDKKGSSSS